jgi:tetratricopeptide (TPR) repeat protein
LLCVAVGLSVAAVLLLVLLTPPVDSTENAISRPAGSSATESVEFHDDHCELVLPLQAEEMDVEETEGVLIDLAEKLLESYPRDAGALYVAGMAYSKMQQSTRAEQLLQRCVDLSPKESLAYLALAENLLLGGKDEEAGEVLEDAIAQQSKSAGLTMGIAEALADLGRLEQATQVLREGVRDFPTDSLMWLRLGQMQIQVHRFADAEASIRRALNLGHVGPSSLAALSTSLVRQGKHEQATEVRKRLADLRSRMESQAGSASDGFQTEYAETFRHNVIQSLVRGSSVYLEHGERRRAESLLKQAIALDPQQTQSYELLATLYERDGRLPDVIVVLHRLIDVQPDNVRHYTNLGRIALRTGKEDLAESVLRQAVGVDPEGGAAHCLLAALYVLQGRNAEAREFAQVAAQRMQTFDAYYLLMSACQALGDHAAAKRALQKARQLAPNDPRLDGVPF